MAQVSIFIGDGYGGYIQGLSLRSDYKNGATWLIGRADGRHLSGFAMRQCGGEVKIPGKRGMGWKLAGELLGQNKPPYFPHIIMNKISWKRWYDKKERNINLVEFVQKNLDDIRRVSDYLEMPKMLEYDQEIIEWCKKFYLRDYIKPKFGSGKLRGKQRFESELTTVLAQLDGLEHWMELEKVLEYRKNVEDIARKSKTDGVAVRKRNREAVAARKRAREQKQDASPDLNNREPKKRRKN